MKVIIRDFSEENIIRQCSKVMRCLALNDTEKVAELLHIDAQMYQNCGSETPKYAKEKVKTMSRNIYRLIKDLDQERGSRFLRAMVND
jgi:hypothetical protein